MSLAPFVLIGCGGSGILSVRHVRDEVLSRLRTKGISKMPDAWQFIGLDTVKTQADLSEATPLPPQDLVHLTTGGIEDLSTLDHALLAAHPFTERGQGYEELFGWRPNPLDLPGSLALGAGQNRAVGRVVGTYALSQSTFINRLQRAITACQAGGNELRNVAEALGVPGANSLDLPPTLYIVIGSTAGGTGAGVMLDVVDVVKRQGGTTVQPILVAFGADIFRQPTTAMASNSLTFFSELTNAVYSTDGGRTGLFGQNGPLPLRRGPGYTFVVGRKNMAGLDLQDSRTAYRAVGITIAGWMTVPAVREAFQAYVLGNWNLAPRRHGGMGFANQQMPGYLSSFGSATISLGRSRFRNYFRAYLMRDLYEHHETGFMKVALNTFGADGNRGAKPSIILRLAEHFFPEVLKDLQLNNKFDDRGGILEGADAQISGAMLSPDHIREVGKVVLDGLNRAMPNGGLNADEWSNVFRGEEQKLRQAALDEGDRQYEKREEQWLHELARRLIVVGNDRLNRLTLPVFIDVMERVNQSVQRAAVDFRNSGAAANTFAVQFRDEAYAALREVGGAKLDRAAPSVVRASQRLAAAIGQEHKARTSDVIARTLEQVSNNLLVQFRQSLVKADEEVRYVTEAQEMGQPSVISGWPTGVQIPKSFVPSPIEFLLEEHDEWPARLRELLLTIDTGRPGESQIDTVRREVCEGSVEEVSDTDTVVRPVLWIRDGDRIRFVKSQPLAFAVDFELGSLTDRVDSWLTDTDRVLGDFFREEMGKYLLDVEHPEHRRRLQKFGEKLRDSLGQAKPLTEVDATKYPVVYPGHGGDLINLATTIDPLPFPENHPAREVTANAFQNVQLGEGGAPSFRDGDTESITFSTFLPRPVHVGLIRSIITPISQSGMSLEKDVPSFRSWLDFKRARRLDEFVPVSPPVLRALIRGFIIGRLTGLVTLGGGHDPVRISSPEGELHFPTPSYAGLNPENSLTSVMLSMPLAFIDFAAEGTNAFRAYAALFHLGVSDEELLGEGQFAVAGVLKEILETGKSSRTILDHEAAEDITGSDKDIRTENMLKVLDRLRSRYEQVKLMNFDGKEHVRAGMQWRTPEVLERELVGQILYGFDEVEKALSTFKVGRLSGRNA